MDIDLLDKSLDKEPGFRKKQVLGFVFDKLITNWDEATSLPKELRETLKKTTPLDIPHQLFPSKDGRTTRALINLNDSQVVETVLMQSKDRNTVCVSSQAGCPMNCAFCATGAGGFKRNLTVSEIVAQVLVFARLLKDRDQKVTNIVYMGMGEPFLNYDNVINSIRFMNSGESFGLGMRRFSVSTCGIADGIKKFADEDFEVNLAISLHSAVGEVRSSLMPINEATGLNELAESIKYYYKKTKRKVMFEYILISGLNMDQKSAEALAHFLQGLGIAYVLNLIPYNEAAGKEFKRPDADEIEEFKTYLIKYKINFVQRYAFGSDVSAACGQLAGKKK
jgi:23S rRNA (adenine2503-C2)-methyltransferase